MSKKVPPMLHLAVMLTFIICIVLDVIWFVVGSMDSWSSFTNDNIFEASRLNLIWFTLLPATILLSFILVVLGFKKNKFKLKVTAMILSLLPVLLYLFFQFT